MKTIDDADLIDDIFMNLVANDPDVGESVCRILLSVLLQKNIGKVNVRAQRVIPGVGFDIRGIRLDVEVEEYESGGEEHIANVYDIEPHKRDEGEFGRMLRYRQAKIDSRYMKKNDNDFSHLPNLYMLLITDKDYFGKDYMLYTFRNWCVELPELEYNDGLCFLYYYTKGTKGGSESIHNMLKYIQDSKRGSAVDDATRELDEYVSNVRRDPEIRGNYMTFGDRIDLEKQMSLEEGIEQGKVQIVENMLKKGKSSAEIADLCGLEVSSVLKIEENMKTLA